VAEAESGGKPGERIAKVMARAGLCSRRAAEDWIAAGRVTVNGQAITSPALNVSPRDRIIVDGKPLPVRERTRLFLYNKPRGLVTTHDDPQGRPTIFSALPPELPRLISVGRLDFTTEGLLLLTNDGGLARILELPSTGWLRRYRVRAHGAVTQPQLDALRKGIEVEGIRYGAIDAVLDRVQGANVWVTFSIREGKNREVRNVLGAIGLEVNRLIRVSYGPFQLGELAEGEVEEVKTRVLREQLGERTVAAAGADFSGPLTVREEGFAFTPISSSSREQAPAGPARRGRKDRPSSSPHGRAEAGGRRNAGEQGPQSSKRNASASARTEKGGRRSVGSPPRGKPRKGRGSDPPRDRSRKPRKR
jgi:23S rRNA pseudouridine2605 synthase